MKRKLLAALLLFGCAFFLLPESAPAQEKSERGGFYSVGSFHSGTSQYIYVGMLAGLARRHLSFGLTNEATGGTTENLDLLRRGELALSVSSPERLHAAYHGLGKYQGMQTPLGIMWGFTQQATLLFTKQASGIKGFRDLAGKKVAIGPAGSSNEIKNSFVLDAYGYTRKEKGKFDFVELQTIKLSYPEAANALAEGVVDATIATQPLPDPAHAELAFRIPLRVIPVDAEMFQKIRDVYPWLWPTRVPAGIYRGQDTELSTLGDPNYIVAHLKNFPEKMAYDLTKIYVEKLLPEMAQQMDGLKPYAKIREMMVSSFVIPPHPGALRYYEEIGLKPQLVKQ